MLKGFTIIDNKTGEYPDIWEIVLTERWARTLRDHSLDSFAIMEDGCLIFVSEDGNYIVCPEGRFTVIQEAGESDA